MSILGPKIFVAFLLLFVLSSCVLTELTLELGQKEPTLEELTIKRNFLDWSLLHREAWAYPIIPIILPFSIVGDFLIDFYDFPKWIFGLPKNESKK